MGEHNAWEKKSNLELGTRVPLVIRAPWKPAAIGASTNALVELVDLYPTFASLAGLPSPPGLDQQGTDLSPLFDNPTQGSAFKNASFSQYPVCSPPTKVREFTAGADCPTCRMCRGCSTNATVDTCGTHGCIGVGRTDFKMMGYSVRVDNWRYTAWLPWVGGNLTGNWSATPISADDHYNPGENYYRELYDHREDNGTCFDCFENENVAELPINAKIVAELHAILRNQFGFAHVKSCLSRSTQAGVNFDTLHHGNVELSPNRTKATWEQQDSCDAVVLLDVDANNSYQFWLDIQKDNKRGFIDIGLCARDVNTSGEIWMGHQKGKAWVYRALGRFADSWITHGKGPSSSAQGVPYGRKYSEGDRVGVKMLNNSAIEFFLNGGSLGVAKTAEPMPPNVVGCASTCMGAILSTIGCNASEWIDVKV